MELGEDWRIFGVGLKEEQEVYFELGRTEKLGLEEHIVIVRPNTVYWADATLSLAESHMSRAHQLIDIWVVFPSAIVTNAMNTVCGTCFF